MDNFLERLVKAEVHIEELAKRVDDLEGLARKIIGSIVVTFVTALISIILKYA